LRKICFSKLLKIIAWELILRKFQIVSVLPSGRTKLDFLESIIYFLKINDPSKDLAS